MLNLPKVSHSEDKHQKFESAVATEMWQALERGHQRKSLMHVLGHNLYMSIILTLFLHLLLFPPVLPTFSCFS